MVFFGDFAYFFLERLARTFGDFSGFFDKFSHRSCFHDEIKAAISIDADDDWYNFTFFILGFVVEFFTKRGRPMS
jgi:hypothetical protein